VALQRTQICHPVVEASCDLSGNRWEVSMTCSDRSHPPCSYCWDGAQSQSPPWWCNPCMWVWWRGWWCCAAGCGAPSWYCALPQLPSLNVLDRYVTDAPAFVLVSCLAYFSTLKMEAICSSETSVDCQWTTWHYIPEDGTLHNHRCETSNPTSKSIFIMPKSYVKRAT
jgi:hypothetical protein